MSDTQETTPTVESVITDVQEGLETVQENQETAPEGEEVETSEEETVDDSEEPQTIEDAQKAKTPAKKEEKKSNKKKFKIKVDQKEEDYELDLDNEEEIKKQLQLARVAQKRMAEMSDLKKDVTDLITRLNKDPFSVLADPESGLGMNVDEIVRQYVEQKLAEAEKSPEQIAREKMENELKALKEEREREKTEREREKYEASLQNEIIKYDNAMTKALENSEFKKPSPYLVKKMSDYMLLGIENGIDITPDEVLPLVREEIQNEIRELINSAPEGVIEEMFGKEIFNKMRKKHVAKAKQAPVHASSVKDAGGKTEKPKETPKISYKDYFKF